MTLSAPFPSPLPPLPRPDCLPLDTARILQSSKTHQSLVATARAQMMPANPRPPLYPASQPANQPHRTALEIPAIALGFFTKCTSRSPLAHRATRSRAATSLTKRLAVCTKNGPPLSLARAHRQLPFCLPLLLLSTNFRSSHLSNVLQSLVYISSYILSPKSGHTTQRSNLAS